LSRAQRSLIRADGEHAAKVECPVLLWRVFLADRRKPRLTAAAYRGHSGPLGPASLRKALYLPASVAMRCSSALRVFADRLRARGKRPKVVITAVMRKLLLLAWTLLRTGQPFSSTHHVQLTGA
jgi:transposase